MMTNIGDASASITRTMASFKYARTPAYAARKRSLKVPGFRLGFGFLTRNEAAEPTATAYGRAPYLNSEGMAMITKAEGAEIERRSRPPAAAGV
jgi:hypothetical protein